MIEVKETAYTTRYDEVVTLIQKWHDDGVSTEEILGIISTVKESVKFSFAMYLRDAIEKQKEKPSEQGDKHD
jgi:pyruvate-formate lyase-activating enzyme